MEHGRHRHLGAEFEPSGSFGPMDLDRLAIAVRDGLDHLLDFGNDSPHEPARSWTDEDAASDALDLAPTDQA